MTNRNNKKSKLVQFSEWYTRVYYNPGNTKRGLAIGLIISVAFLLLVSIFV